MNALDAVEELNELNRRIESLDRAYDYLWDDFDLRPDALVLQKIKNELIEERDVLAEKLRRLPV